MIANPKVGQVVQVHYNKQLAPVMPLHGKIGIVMIVSKDRPRNHGVLIDGTFYIVSCGNLRLPKEMSEV